jgi:hypothetical protein
LEPQEVFPYRERKKKEHHLKSAATKRLGALGILPYRERRRKSTT